MSELRDADVVVIGLGTSGLAAVRVAAVRGARVRVTEERPRAEVEQAAREAEAARAEVLAGGHRPEHLDAADLVVVSPGVPERAPVLRWARQRRIPVWSELELGARLAEAPYVGVTGTNGKTTTTEMIAAAMRAGGLDAVACGNIGHPFSVAATEGHQALVVEASSFQLRFHRTFHPRVSVLLNLAPDHLDWHGTLDRYRDAKARIFELQGAEDVHVGNRDDPHAAALSRRAHCPVRWFTLADPRPGEAGFRDGALALGPGRTFGGPASSTDAHRADAAAALAAAVAFGVDADAAASAIVAFPPLAHRGAVVAEVGGVRFVDDSKATNPHAALAALSSLDRAVLVAGGRSKGLDLSPLAAAIPRLAGVVALGEAAPELERLFAGRVPVRRVGSIEEAVVEAHRMASPGETVLLAPACASQDMFRDYRERGERFASAARRLQEVDTHA
ncbi:MAG TPA: UDP-N-acetylmuramoyl-L-alanine--D-glutamate ligase [Actinomycetota bacterium]|nr:UDP-N-acetylmuramoyl-L-alanine--D-glutamate ligase [Actinomycetota bacterium]